MAVPGVLQTFYAAVEAADALPDCLLDHLLGVLTNGNIESKTKRRRNALGRRSRGRLKGKWASRIPRLQFAITLATAATDRPLLLNRAARTASEGTHSPPGRQRAPKRLAHCSHSSRALER